LCIWYVKFNYLFVTFLDFVNFKEFTYGYIMISIYFYYNFES
jgi:hypothetical protein